jgi:hypothetical protein
MTKTSCLAFNCLVLLLSFSFIPRDAAHSFLVCTHLQEDVPGQECSDVDNFPTHRKIDPCVRSKPESSMLIVCRQAGHGYEHSEPGPLCKPGTGKLLTRAEQQLTCSSDVWTMASGTQTPTVKAGDQVVLAFAGDNHDNFAQVDQADDGGALGRFVYVFHSPVEEPDDALFKTTPYAQFDFQVCGNKIGSYGRGQKWSSFNHCLEANRQYHSFCCVLDVCPICRV